MTEENMTDEEIMAAEYELESKEATEHVRTRTREFITGLDDEIITRYGDWYMVNGCREDIADNDPMVSIPAFIASCFGGSC